MTKIHSINSTQLYIAQNAEVSLKFVIHLSMEPMESFYPFGMERTHP